MIQNLDELIENAPIISEIIKDKFENRLMIEEILKEFDDTVYSTDYDCQSSIE